MEIPVDWRKSCMEDFDRPLGSAVEKVGPLAREIGQCLGFSIFELSGALTDSMEKFGYHYDDTSVSGFLYKRRWPQMTRDTAINIVADAFENILKSKKRNDEIPKVKKIITAKMKRICSDCENESINRWLKRTAADIRFTHEYPEFALFISKNFKACCSLTENDIEFWNSIRPWTKRKKEKQCEKWSTKKVDFQTVTNPSFRQWLTLQNKSYSDSSRKKHKDSPNLSKEFRMQLKRATVSELNSVNYIVKLLIESDSEKYPLGPPEEIGLLILFKYFFSVDEQNSILEKIRNKKSGG